MQNINDAQKHYDEIHADKLQYIQEGQTALNIKKANYGEHEYLDKLNRFKLKKQKADDQYTKNKQKTKTRLEKLNVHTQYTKRQQEIKVKSEKSKDKK
ncbi:hypothetical protein FACS1894152_4880 [Bacilli bacterium]|nr:hypothetical protein FACS1894152_4880 [Bacilli bacterium]